MGPDSGSLCEGVFIEDEGERMRVYIPDLLLIKRRTYSKRGEYQHNYFVFIEIFVFY